MYDPKAKIFMFNQWVILDEDSLISHPHPHHGLGKLQDNHHTKHAPILVLHEYYVVVMTCTFSSSWCG